MGKEHDDIILIEKYLEKKLTVEELQEFERRKSEDSTFQKQVKEMHLLIEGIKNAARESVLDDLKELEETLPEVIVKKRMPLRRNLIRIGWGLAAACVAGIIAVSVSVNPVNNHTYETLYNEYFTPYPNVIEATKRSEDQTLTLKEEAFYEYDLGNYTTAIEKFSVLNEKEKDATLLFYMGNAYMAIGKTEDAIHNFKLIRNSDHKFQNQAKWYLCLAYLKNNQIEEVKNILSELKRSNSAYREKADMLLKEIDY